MIPVPPKVPVFDLSQEDEDDARESPPTPAPPVIITAGLPGKPKPAFLAGSGKFR